MVKNHIYTLIFTVLGCSSSVCFAQELAIPVYFELYVDDDSELYRYAPPHPCGRVLSLRSNRVPVNLSTFDVLWAYRLSAAGEILIRWPLPVDVTPVGIAGNRLTIRMAVSQELVFLMPSGEIGLPLEAPWPLQLRTSTPTRVECPAVSDQSVSLNGYFCALVPENLSEEDRIIAYPPICT